MFIATEIITLTMAMAMCLKRFLAIPNALFVQQKLQHVIGVGCLLAANVSGSFRPSLLSRCSTLQCRFWTFLTT